MGWTPLFDSLSTGTLYGRWPDIGLWAVVLSLADKRGIVDVTPEYLAGVTGLPVFDVVACMERFRQPDPRSRTGTEAGARLVLIDPSRTWGWRIVNHSLYRERARKQAWDQERTQSGRDAERKRVSRADVPSCPDESRRVPRSPDASRLSPLSDTNTNIHKTAHTVPRKRGCRVPEPFPITEDMRAWALVKCPHVKNVDGATEEFVDYWRGVAGRAATKLDWEGTWRNRMRELEERASRKNGTAKEAEWR